MDKGRRVSSFPIQLGRDSLRLGGRVDWQRYFEALAKIKISETLPALGSYPKLLVYCQGDKYIPHQAAMEVFDKVSQPKELLLAKDGYWTY